MRNPFQTIKEDLDGILRSYNVPDAENVGTWSHTRQLYQSHFETCPTRDLDRRPRERSRRR